jgi:hypothetical protein
MGIRNSGPARFALLGVSILTAAASLLSGAAPAVAQTASQGNGFCSPGQPPQFQGGFATLWQIIPEQMGQPLECEHLIDSLGNTQQLTTTGLAYYVKVINLSVFTDGTDHWTINNDGLVDWTDTPLPPGVVLPPLGSSKDYAIPLNTAGDLGDGWTVTVQSVTPNATAQILSTSNTNFQPAPNTQYVMAHVTATYTGQIPRRFDRYRLLLVGGSGSSYSSYENTCGVVPNPMPDSEVQPGASIQGNVCWTVNSADVPSLALYDEVLLITKQRYLFFAVR